MPGRSSCFTTYVRGDALRWCW